MESKIFPVKCGAVEVKSSIKLKYSSTSAKKLHLISSTRVNVQYIPFIIIKYSNNWLIDDVKSVLKSKRV